MAEARPSSRWNRNGTESTDPDQPNQRRHMQEWRWQNPSGASPEHVFTLSIPFSELREISSAEDLSGVQWLDSPGHGQVVDIQFFVVAHSAAQSASRRHHLATLDLDSQHSLVLLVRRGDITPDVLRELERSRTTLRTEAVEQALRLEPGYRAAILFSYDANGVRGMFELVPEG